MPILFLEENLPHPPKKKEFHKGVDMPKSHFDLSPVPPAFTITLHKYSSA